MFRPVIRPMLRILGKAVVELGGKTAADFAQEVTQRKLADRLGIPNPTTGRPTVGGAAASMWRAHCDSLLAAKAPAPGGAATSTTGQPDVKKTGK